jgi:hypothetical protein
VGNAALAGAAGAEAVAEAGPRWGSLAQHRASRFVVASSLKCSEEEAAAEVVPLTRDRTAGRRGIGWISDGLHAYKYWIQKVYRDPERTPLGRTRKVPTPGVGLTQIVKTRKGYRIVKVRVRHCFGPPTADPQTVRVERLNGALRDRLNCLTRKTHGFAKRDRTWKALVGLGLFAHNWMREHPALREEAAGLPDGRRYTRRSPAMALGLSDHVWSWAELLTWRVHR